jgi:hypothetical protein
MRGPVAPRVALRIASPFTFKVAIYFALFAVEKISLIRCPNLWALNTKGETVP